MSPAKSLGKLMIDLGELGELQVLALLNILISDAVLFFNVGKSMGKVQVTQTAQLILEDYKHFKPEDFKLCFKNAMKGHYNPQGLFDRIDGQVILDWLIKYDNERDAEIEAIRARENKELKSQAGLSKMFALPQPGDNRDDVFKANIAKLHADRAERKRLRDQVAEVNKEMERDKGPVYEMHQRWIEQFAAIRIKQGSFGKGTIIRYGMMVNPFYRPDKADEPKIIPRTMDINTYLEHKQWQYLLALTPRDNRLNQYKLKYK